MDPETNQYNTSPHLKVLVLLKSGVIFTVLRVYLREKLKSGFRVVFQIHFLPNTQTLINFFLCIWQNTYWAPPSGSPRSRKWYPFQNFASDALWHREYWCLKSNLEKNGKDRKFYVVGILLQLKKIKFRCLKMQSWLVQRSGEYS